MAFPTTMTTVANLASTLTSPAAARTDLLAAVQNLNRIIDEVNTAGGIVTLSNTAVIANANVVFPKTVTVAGTFTIAANTGRTVFANILRLQPREETAITSSTDPEVGDIHFCANLQSYYAGTPGLVFYSNANVSYPWNIFSITQNGVPI